ncbi:solute carrier family 22 member 8 [Elysia marginata]|uniref:Solute carrier family 22 member 8 n=1 Tax=Elysia marginata TaxID=1093978 RepID=A0AAV4I820_9GAST|nr:solute carrier family 22 member 8 [Elysia marginata]
MAIEHIFDQIGGFGRFQVLFIFWVYGIKFMIAWSTMLLSFASFKNQYACVVDSVFNQSELEILDEGEVWSIAKRGFNNESLIDVCEVDGVGCQSFYFFGTKRTITSEWNLVCDLRWMKATITSIQFVGLTVGAIIGGQSGDYFGRNKTLYGSYLLHSIFNVIAAFSVSWQMFAVLRFLIGVTIGMVLVMIVPYSTEFYPIKWRHVIPPAPMWPLGVCAFAMAAWLLEDWADLHLACAALGIPGLLGYFYIPESPRWLATQGREEEAHAALTKMARFNAKQLPASARETIQVGHEWLMSVKSWF